MSRQEAAQTPAWSSGDGLSRKQLLAPPAPASLGWTDQSSWLQGEPCVDQWKGIYCCPEDRPHLVKNSATSREEADPRHYACRKTFMAAPSAVGSKAAVGSGNVSLDEDLDLAMWNANAGEMWPAGCRGSAVGAKATANRCVVVMLELRSNGLAGTVPEGLGQIPTLLVLDIRDNQQLTGTLPDFLIEHDWLLLGIGGNSFQYAKDGSDEASLNDHDVHDSVVMLMHHCSQADVWCEGLPPRSCSAFGSERCNGCFFVVETLDPTKCVSCEPSPLKPILTIIGMALAGLVFLVGYAWLVQRYPGMIQGGWSTFAIFLQHTQTVSIMCQLRLQWPPTVLAILEGLGFSLFSIEIGRPECLLGDVDENLGGPFYMISMIKFIILLFTFLALWTLSGLLATRSYLCLQSSHQQREQQRKSQKRSERAVDQLDMVESIIFHCQVILAWKLIFQFLATPEDRASIIWQISFVLAIMLIISEVFLMCKYFFYLHVLQVKESRQMRQALPPVHALGALENELISGDTCANAVSECDESPRTPRSLLKMAPPPTTPQYAASTVPAAPPARPDAASTSSRPLPGSLTPSPPTSPPRRAFKIKKSVQWAQSVCGAADCVPFGSSRVLSRELACGVEDGARAQDGVRRHSASAVSEQGGEWREYPHKNQKQVPKERTLGEADVCGDANANSTSNDIEPQLDKPRDDDDGSEADDLDVATDDDSLDCADDLEDAEEDATLALDLGPDGLANRKSSRFGCGARGPLRRLYYRSFSSPFMKARRLRARVSYLRRRYGLHAQKWQFMNWGLQLALLLISLAGDIRVSAVIAAASAANGTSAANEISAANDTSEGRLSEMDTAVLTSVGRFQAASACALLIAFLVLHLRVQPYVYRFQNWMETSLLATDVSTMAIGVLVSFIGWTPALELTVIAIVSATAGGAMLFMSVRLALYIKLCLNRKLSAATSLRESVYDIARDIGVPGFSGRASQARASRQSVRQSTANGVSSQLPDEPPVSARASSRGSDVSAQRLAECEQRMLTVSLRALELHELLGNGGTGNMYRATCHTKGVAARRIGAIALKSGKSVEALHSEHLALSLLHHPHLVRVLSLAADPLQLVSTIVICELAQMSLHAALQNGHLEAGNWTGGLLKVCYETMSGLTFLHERGVYHGALHPRNVLLSSKLKVKLADYARHVCELPNFQDERGDGCARWAYVAAEQWEAEADGGVVGLPHSPFKTKGKTLFSLGEKSLFSMGEKSMFGLGEKSMFSLGEKKSFSLGKNFRSLGEKSHRVGQRFRESVGSKTSRLGEASTTQPRADAKGPKDATLAKPAREVVNALAMADMWSFGCLVSLTATGEPPYSAEIEARVSSQSSAGEVIKAACKHGISPLHRFHNLAQVLDDGSSAASTTGGVTLSMLHLASQCVQINPYARPRASHVRSKIDLIGQAAKTRVPKAASNTAGEPGLSRDGFQVVLAGHHSSSKRLPLPSRLPAPTDVVPRLPLPSRLPAPTNVAQGDKTQGGTRDHPMSKDQANANRLMHLVDLHRQSGAAIGRQRRDQANGLADGVYTVVDGTQAARLNHRLRI